MLKRLLRSCFVFLFRSNFPVNTAVALLSDWRFKLLEPMKIGGRGESSAFVCIAVFISADFALVVPADPPLDFILLAASRWLSGTKGKGDNGSAQIVKVYRVNIALQSLLERLACK